MIVSLYTVWTNTSTPSDISNNTKHIFTTMVSSFLSTDPADGSDEIDEMQWRTFYLFASFAISLGHYTFFTAFISATSRDRSRRVNFDVTDTPSRRQSGDSGFTVESERD